MASERKRKRDTLEQDDSGSIPSESPSAKRDHKDDDPVQVPVDSNAYKKVKYSILYQ